MPKDYVSTFSYSFYSFPALAPAFLLLSESKLSFSELGNDKDLLTSLKLKTER